MIDQSPLRWSTVDAAEMYEVPRWGNGYFSVGPNGNVLVHPDRNPARSVDLKELIQRLQMRGLDVSTESFAIVSLFCTKRSAMRSRNTATKGTTPAFTRSR